jgi:hypothetical protein
MGGFMSREQTVQGANAPRRNTTNRNIEAGRAGYNRPPGANAPRVNANGRNLEAPNTTRRNKPNNRLYTRNTRNTMSLTMGSNGEASDPEVVVHTPPESPANTVVNVNRGFRNNATPNRPRNNRINVVVNQGPPNNATRINVAPEEEETPQPPGNPMVGGRHKRRPRILGRCMRGYRMSKKTWECEEYTKPKTRKARANRR